MWSTPYCSALVAAAVRSTLFVGLVAMTQAASAQAPGAGALAASGLVGKLEGAQLVLDPALRPSRYQEAPALGEMVKAGRLPAVGERLPADPLVIRPLRETGRYGGTWRRGFIGPADGENGNRINASDKLVFWDATGTKIVPSLAKSWQTSADGRTLTLTLRRGLKWSDGAPFNADDFVFWFEDLYSNKDIVPVPVADMSINGKPGRVVKIADDTVAFQFDDPYYLFLDILAGDTPIGGGQSARQSQNYTYGAYAPAHYLKKFLPKYSSEQLVTQAAKAEGFETWVRMLHFKKDWLLNPELPTVGPWHMQRPINTLNWVLERNPYYWAVDTEGNQLPYIDRIVMTLAQDTEVLNLRAIAGEYDMQERNVDLGKLPVLLENRQKADYSIHLDLAFNGSDTTLHLNQSYAADPEIARWLTNVDFRRALSLGIDREQLNETFWLGTGIAGSIAPAEATPFSPGADWRKKWSTYDPVRANGMLDALGLAKRDGDGFRLRADNGEKLRLQVTAVKALLPWPQQAEMIAQQWKKIGIQADVREMERSLAITQTRNNEHQVFVWTNGGTEMLYLYPQLAIPVIPNESYMGPQIAIWFGSGGKQGVEPKDPQMQRALALFRSASGQDAIGRENTAKEIWKILVDQQYSIGTVGQSPAFMGVRLVSNRLGNIPERACIAQHCRTPGSSHPETWFFKN